MACVGDAIEVYWPEDEQYYAGKVVAVHPTTNVSSILYDDGESEDLDLSKEKWHFTEKLLDISSQCSSHVSLPSFRCDSEVGTLKSMRKSPSSSRPTRASTMAARSKAEVPTGVSKRSTTSRKKRCFKPSSAIKSPSPLIHSSLLASSPQNNTLLDSGPVELLIGKAVESWLCSETRRGLPSTMFSPILCLRHSQNVLTYAVTDPRCAAQLRQRSAGSNSNWIFTGIINEKEQRYRYCRWSNPLTDREWEMEKLLLTELTGLVTQCRVQMAKQKYELNVAEVRALGIVIAALELGRRGRKR